MTAQFKVADSIAVDTDGYAYATLVSIESDHLINDETGEINDQLLFIWETKTRKGKETKIRFWTGLNINPIPKKDVKGKVTYNALTTLLLIHKVITNEDLKKIAIDENYVNEIEFDLTKMVDKNHKFKLITNNKGLSKPDISTLKIIEDLNGVKIITTPETSEN